MDQLHRINDDPSLEAAHETINALRTMSRNVSGVEQRINEANEQISMLRQELDDERQKRLENEKKAEEAEKKNRAIDRRLGIWIAILSIALTVAFTLLLKALGVNV